MSQSSTTALIDLGNTSVRDRLNAIISDVEKDEDSSPEKREWKVFINPMNDASVSKKLKSDDDQVKTDRIPSIAFNRMLTRTIIPKELGDYTPRTILSKQLSNSYHQTISSLLKLSNKEMLSMRDFVERKHNGKVNLSQFVELMIYHTTMYKFFNKKDDLLHCIQQLFNIIDINSDGHICWSEFTTYLVDAAQSRVSKPNNSNLIRYETSNKVDPTQHNNVVIKVKYLQSIDSLVTFEKNSRVFRIYSKDLKLKKIVRGHRGFLLDVVEIPNFELVATSSADQTISFWDIKQNDIDGSYFTPLKVWDMNKPILSIQVGGTLLYCGDLYGSINAYSIGSKGECKYTWTKHYDCITCLKYIESINVLFSASMDTMIGIWDTIQEENIALLGNNNKGHQYGVLFLEYDIDKHLLFSAGQDSYILIWEIDTKYLDDNDDIKGRQLHWKDMKYSNKIPRRYGTRKTNSIVQLEYLQDSNELIVCDIESVFRVFKVNSTYDNQCLQTWFAGNGSVENVIASKQKKNKQNKKINGNQSDDDDEDESESATFDHRIVSKHNLSQEPADWNFVHKIVSKYSKHKKFQKTYSSNVETDSIYDFTVVSNTKDIICSKGLLVKFERLSVEGKQEHLMPIIAAKFDPNTLKIIVVTSTNVHIFDSLTGAKIIQFDANIIGKINENNGETAANTTIDMIDLNTEQIHDINITSCCFDQECKRIFISTDKGKVGIFNLFSGSFLTSLESESPSQAISHLIYLKQRKVVSTLENGAWVMHHDDPDTTATKFLVKQDHFNEITCITTSDDHDDEPGLLATGDCIGNINIYQLGSAHSISLDLHNNYITALEFIKCKNKCYLISCDNTGLISLWHCIPTTMKTKIKFHIAWLNNYQSAINDELDILFQDDIKNRNDIETNKNSNVAALCYDDYDGVLFIGDDKGNLSKWELYQSTMSKGQVRAPKLLKLKHNLYDSAITGCNLFDDNTYITTYSNDGKVKIINGEDLEIHGVIKPDHVNNNNSLNWKVELQSIRHFDEIKSKRLNTILENEETKNLDLKNIETNNLFHLTQINEFESVDSKIMKGVETKYININPKTKSSLTTCRSLVDLNINNQSMKQKTKPNKQSLRRCKSTSWLNLVPKQPKMLQTDPFDGHKFIKIGEKAIQIDTEEAQMLQDFDILLNKFSL